ncbi:tRNA pseudouridine synthase-like 1 [Strongyloides ratti]|uniref:tRNA pseudouridine synthase n=1 Tax=Strongyloides ratti TaxID=34506 RepID=A0A090LHE5_STRRB|nr:tRNA pseudouridine synthase-like 1 [Strongyloides ratti]CEF66925.1 tRNA pseudouridine synthase-like 1 [Strongyloides ratti]
MGSRYLLRICYDGSRFTEMAKNPNRTSVISTLEKVISSIAFNGHSSEVFCSPSSRTDAGVHALNNAVLLRLPQSKDLVSNKEEFLNEYCHRVALGFSCRQHVSYRIYTYRLAIAKNFDIFYNRKKFPSLVCSTERDYSWILPPGFNTGKAQEACNMLKGVHNMASFFKHSCRDRNEILASVGIGKAKVLDNNFYDYVNISIVSRSFVRQQIRRMLSLIVEYSYGKINTSTIKYFLNNPNPSNFYKLKVCVAPPNGLFLTDVVYDPRMFTQPIPYCISPWDPRKGEEELDDLILKDP